MSDAVLEGAVMPEGIEVDEAAAYFGVVDSSDAVHQMMAMNHLKRWRISLLNYRT